MVKSRILKAASCVCTRLIYIYICVCVCVSISARARIRICSKLECMYTNIGVKKI